MTPSALKIVTKEPSSLTDSPDFDRLFSERARAIQSSAIREILKVTERPEVISFAGGLPSSATFPVEQMQASFDRVLAQNTELFETA